MAVYNRTLIQLALWKDAGLLDEQNEYLGDLALNLASVLDNGAGLAQAAVANQYRACMAEIAKNKNDDDDREFEKFLGSLGTPGNPALGNSA